MSDEVLAGLLERIHQLENSLSALGQDVRGTKRRTFPSKRQQIVLSSITRALCVETVDPWKENRVRFYHPLLHDPDTPLLSLPFAAPVSAMGGFDDCGLNWVPPAGSTLMLFFEGGDTDSPFYLGTTWHRNRGAHGADLMRVFPSREYQNIYDGHRGGYLNPPNDESQVLPPWNEESANGPDIYAIEQFNDDPEAQTNITYPNIYGFKTPEKHMLKMVDGNAKCNRRWKRLELQSGDGNWMIFKDDHLHYGGQWAHPSCGAQPGGADVSTCNTASGDDPFLTDIQGNPIEQGDDCGDPILGGTPSTPCDPQTVHCNSNTGSNPNFKHENECRPYKGPQTPQNNRCDLPQSGIQFLSISGQSFLMDDSVESPRGTPGWERSTEAFDFGCTNKFFGRIVLKTATGQKLIMSDVEDLPENRGKDNYIKLLSASGNKIELNDETQGGASCYAGENRGIHLQSTSDHQINMVDHLNLQCSPPRTEGGVPTPQATAAYMQLKSGYGLEMRFNDDFSQQTTQSQWIQILHPQCVSGTTDEGCNSGEADDLRGAHFLRMQGRPKGQPGIVFLRAGGHAIRMTYDMDIVVVGDKDKNPSDKFTYVTRKYITASDDVNFNYTKKMHIMFAENQIMLLAGRDCPPPPGKKCKGPCLYNVIVARCPVFCPITGILHWTEKAMSERVFASGYDLDCSSGQPQNVPGQGAPCTENSTSSSPGSST